MPGAPLAATPLTQAPDLVHTSEKTFYPQPIPLQHQQLRHLLKTTDSGFTYYASQNKVYALKDGKRKLIATLDFRIQCLTAGFGWLCLGSPEEDGRCAFLRLQTGDQGEANRLTAEVDASLPLNLRSLARANSPEGLRHVRPASSRDFPQSIRSINYRKIGEQIVNAITLQTIKPGRRQEKDAQDEVVAVVAMNNNTVSIFSLDRMLILDVIHFETHMNHASLHPDGKLLLACGDVNKAFFYRRTEQGLERNEKGRMVWSDHTSYKWEPVAAPTITGFPSDDHCFTTAFSPDGQFCTIASQAGLMVHFDVRAIHTEMKDGEGILDRSTCSRPAPSTGISTYYWRGAIRSTAFSPSIWAMYAWAETRGRICIRDLRNPHRPGQVVHLSKKSPENVVIELVDAAQEDSSYDDEPINSLRLLGTARPTRNDIRDQLSAMHQTVDYIEQAHNHRQLQQFMSALDRSETPRADDPPPRLRDLMAQIHDLGQELENSSREHSTRALPLPPRRQSSVVFGQRDSSTPGATSLAPILSHTSTLSASPSQISRDRAAASLIPPATLPTDNEATIQTISAAMDAASPSQRASMEVNLRHLLETPESLQRVQRSSRQQIEHSTRDMEWERQSTARTQTSRPVGSNSSASGSRTANAIRIGRGAYGLDAQTRTDLEESLQYSQTRLAQLERDLEQLDRQTRLFAPSGTHESDAAAAAAPSLDPAIVLAMRNAENARYQRLWQIEHRANPYPTYDGGGDNDEPEIMGLDWSHDGRKIFVATEVGIFELKVNLNGRKTFAAPIRPR